MTRWLTDTAASRRFPVYTRSNASDVLPLSYAVDAMTTLTSTSDTGDVWRIPVAGDSPTAQLTFPGGVTQPVPVHEGRAVHLGTRAGFYDLTLPTGTKTSFAANLLDGTESAIAPMPELIVDGQRATALEGFQVGVRREIWIYLLIAVLILTATSRWLWAMVKKPVTTSKIR